MLNLYGEPLTGNSRKDPARQGDVIREVGAQIRSGGEGILGVMIESQLHSGRQDWQPGKSLKYGISITDACIGFEETEQLLRELATAMRPRVLRTQPERTASVA